jgi:peroxiredoxin (alkyl hydroperoxide reductase subunit C)
MPEEPKCCARGTGALLGERAARDSPTHTSPESTKEERMTARVGYKASDFNAPVYCKGEFTNIQLSDFFGKWILLCLYPGDFTFV